MASRIGEEGTLRRLIADPRTPSHIRKSAETRLAKLTGKAADRAQLHRALDAVMDRAEAKGSAYTKPDLIKLACEYGMDPKLAAMMSETGLRKWLAERDVRPAKDALPHPMDFTWKGKKVRNKKTGAVGKAYAGGIGSLSEPKWYVEVNGKTETWREVDMEPTSAKTSAHLASRKDWLKNDRWKVKDLRPVAVKDAEGRYDYAANNWETKFLPTLENALKRSSKEASGRRYDARIERKYQEMVDSAKRAIAGMRAAATEKQFNMHTDTLRYLDRRMKMN